MTKEEYPLLGLHCAGCAARAEQVLRELEGVHEANVNLATASAQISYNESLISEQALAEAIARAGYQLVVEQRFQDDEELERLRSKELGTLRSNAITALAVGFLLMGLMWVEHSWRIAYAEFVLTTLTLAIVGRGFYSRAWRQLFDGGMGMDTLVSLSTLVAYGYSVFLLFSPQDQVPHLYFEAAVMIIAFVLLGKYLEGRAKGNTTEAIRRLAGLQPKQVLRRKLSGETEEVSVDDLLLGDCIVVRAGERIAVDGLVAEGESYVDESMLTGEAIPQLRSEGSEVFAGSINQNGSLVIRTTALHRDTLLGRIIDRVRTAQGSKAPIQRIVDRVAALFVPIILALSLLTFGLWYMLGGPNALEQGLVSAITVLIIACPCALGLATPTAIMVGIGRAAEEGILIKDAESLEIARSIDTVVFDKTGTLSRGKPRLLDMHIVDDSCSRQELSKRLGNIERRSEHPIAQAILQGLGEIESVELDSWTNIPGQGLRAELLGSLHLIGSEALMQAEGITLDAEALRQSRHYEEELSASPLYLAWDGKLRAILAVADEEKEGIRELIQGLQHSGIEVHLLSGDNKVIVAQWADRLGIQQAIGEVRPTEKADYVQGLRLKGHRVAMLGDGINDSAALAEATLSIAMGTGSDIAIESAQATITSGEVHLLPRLLELSRRTIRTIHQNLFWAFVYNLLAIPLAAGLFAPLTGWTLTPMLASLMMALSSVSVVLNSLRLRRQ